MYSDQEITDIAMKVADAVNYLHKQSVIHRDIKPENILLDEEGSVFVIDFGIARRVAEGEKCITKHGSPLYRAPEVISGTGYDEKADVWSFGITLYTILQGRYPFGERGIMRYAKGEIPLKFSDSVKPEFQVLIRRLLDPNPATRPTMEEALLQLRAIDADSGMDRDAMALMEDGMETDASVVEAMEESGPAQQKAQGAEAIAQAFVLNAHE